MRKLFTFLFAALMSVGMFAATEVTITNSDFPMFGTSCTKDGVTVSAGSIDGRGNINGPGSFSTTLGNFTKIEVTANNVSIVGPGWNGTSGKKTWTGNASSLSFNGGIMSMGMGVTLKFTIADPTVAVTGVTLNQNEAQMTVGGETLTLTATVNPNNATDQSVSWSTSDANVATVENGVVTAVAAGTATITVTTTDGSYTATCDVTVTAPEPEPEPAGDEITVTWNDPSGYGFEFTQDGVTLTCTIDDWELYGPGTFTTDLGNFTQIVVSAPAACYIDATGGWSGNNDQMTWTGNAAIVPFDGAIYSFDDIVFTIEPKGGASAIENTNLKSEIKNHKLIKDGMLFIEKNGKLFNVTGAEVK